MKGQFAGRFNAPRGSGGAFVGKGGAGLGPGGTCSCPACGFSMQHNTGSPCYDLKCPKCGNSLIRG